MGAGLAWDHRGVCLAVATDCTLFVAAVRINHMYVVCGDTLVYAHTARTAHEHSLSFWNTRNGESHHKSTPAVLGLAASDRYVAVATSDGTWAKQSIVLHDSIGSPVDSRAVPFEPSMLAMTADHVVACSAELVYVWRFCTPEVRGMCTALGLICHAGVAVLIAETLQCVTPDAAFLRAAGALGGARGARSACGCNVRVHLSR